MGESIVIILLSVTSCVQCVLCTKILPIMLALCSMLLPSYYAQAYSSVATIKDTGVNI